jgi:Acetyltransferase (GNAT) domain
MLRGLFPVLMPRLPFAPGEVRLWRPPGFPIAPALVDRDYAEAVFDAALSFCASRGARCSSFVLAGVSGDGPLAAAIRGGGHRSEALSPPPLRASAEDHEPKCAGPAATRALDRARTPAQVRDAVETFLVLDAAAARHRGEPALIEDAGRASFIRTMTRQLARRGQCGVEMLKQDGRALAALIVLRSPQTLWLWRSAGPAPDVEHIAAALASRARRYGRRLIVAEDVDLVAEAGAALGAR